MSSKQNKDTLSQFKVSCTNVKGLSVGNRRGDKKIGRILSLKSDISVLTESRTCHGKLNALKSRLRSQLSGFTLYGHNSTDRGISILVKQGSGIVLDALTEIDNKNILTFNAILPDQTKVFIICVYGPSADSPAFWESVLELYNDNECDYRMILGELH